MKWSEEWLITQATSRDRQWPCLPLLKGMTDSPNPASIFQGFCKSILNQHAAQHAASISFLRKEKELLWAITDPSQANPVLMNMQNATRTKLSQHWAIYFHSDYKNPLLKYILIFLGLFFIPLVSLFQSWWAVAWTKCIFFCSKQNSTSEVAWEENLTSITERQT